jgi:hypothetical protein
MAWDDSLQLDIALEFARLLDKRGYNDLIGFRFFRLKGDSRSARVLSELDKGSSLEVAAERAGMCKESARLLWLEHGAGERQRRPRGKQQDILGTAERVGVSAAALELGLTQAYVQRLVRKHQPEWLTTWRCNTIGGKRDRKL